VFLSGLLFALGLGLSGMTDANKVIAFLDVAGDWDPSLAFVMGGAILVHAPAQRAIRQRTKPILSTYFRVPTRNDISPRLLGGAALFGIGWAIGGYCPGPGLVATASGEPHALVFALSLLVGMALFHALERRMTRPHHPPHPSPPSAPPAA
jgi:uncharacterized membrane protein YedE/YeeE